MLDLLFILLISGLIGGRALHCLLNIDSFRARPVEILFVQHGGLAIHGAILLGTAAGAAFLLIKKIPVWKAGDLLAQYLPLGQSIGRIGCLLNGCCYGRPSGHFGIALPGDAFMRHPTQAYEALALIAVFFILRAYAGRRPGEGRVLLSYFILYSILRFFIDFLREDMPGLCFSLTASQLISAGLFAASCVMIFFLPKRRL